MPQQGKRRRQLQSIRAILDQELTLQDGFSDLVYVLETLFELGLATEDAVLPVFQRLLALREGQDRATIEPMREVQAELRDRFALDLTERTTSRAARL